MTLRRLSVIWSSVGKLTVRDSGKAARPARSGGPADSPAELVVDAAAARGRRPGLWIMRCESGVAARVDPALNHAEAAGEVLDSEGVADAEVLVVDEHPGVRAGAHEAEDAAGEARRVGTPDAPLGQRERLVRALRETAIEAAQVLPVGIA